MRCELRGDELVIHNGESHLDLIRKLPGRRWDGRTETWRVPYVVETAQALLSTGSLDHLPVPRRFGYTVDVPFGKELLIMRTLCSPEDVVLCRNIPQTRSYNSQLGGWLCAPTQVNIEYLRKAFPNAEWSDHAVELAAPKEERERLRQAELLARKQHFQGAPVPIDDFKFPVKPMTQQAEAFVLMRDQPVFALFMEQGTGKTYVLLCDAVDKYLKGQITGVLVICPNGVKSNWEEELPDFSPPDIELDIFVWEGRTRHKANEWVHQVKPGHRPFRWLIMNVEAFSSAKGHELANLFLSKHSCLIVVDESSKLKSPTSARTKSVTKLRKLVKWARIMSGLPNPKSPLDLYSQFRLLDPDILGFSTYYTFRNHFATMGGFNGKIVVGYSNLEELQALIKPYVYRVLKDECMDLPPKVWTKRYVELTPEQRRLYDEMRDNMVTEMAGQKSSVKEAMQRIMRLQRIVGGFLPVDVDDEDNPHLRTKPIQIEGGNPKLEELLEIIDELADNEKIIVWANFRAELALIAETLEKKFGADSVVRFYGGVAESVRNKGRREFQRTNAGPRFFVGQPKAGGIGLNLVSAHTVVYFSNSDNLEDRVQSEDRSHRKGQVEKVTYIDLTCRGTTDVKIVAGLRSKKGLAEIVHGDPKLTWI